MSPEGARSRLRLDALRFGHYTSHPKPFQVQRLLDQRLDPHRHPLSDHLQVPYPLRTTNIVLRTLSFPIPPPASNLPRFSRRTARRLVRPDIEEPATGATIAAPVAIRW